MKNEIVLSKDEAESLADFIDLNLIDVIRNDTDIDSIEWLCNICSIYKKCEDVLNEKEN